MNRLDRYYIPPGVPARPPAPPLPRKGILMMPPPLPPQNPMAMSSQHRFPSSHPHVDYPTQSSAGSNWSYQATPNMQKLLQPPQQQQQQQPHHQQPMSPANLQHLTALSLQNIPAAVQFPGKIRPDRMARMPIPRLVGIDYEELPPFAAANRLDSQNLATAMSLSDTSPRQALQRILFLYENGEHREAAAFMRRLSFQTFRQILPQLPADIFVESMPHSLPILEALYAKIFLGNGNQAVPGAEAKMLGRANSLRPDAVVWQLVKFFAGQEEEMSASGQMRWEFCGPFISSCKRLLAVILAAQPRSRRILAERRRALMKAIEGLGQHSLVGTSEGLLLNLHCALKIEFEKVQKRYAEALQKLESLSLVTSANGAASGGKAPIAQSHQRQLSLKASEIQERLIKNKTLLNVVEPTLENTSLEVLLGILQQRIELDKECLFQFTQVKKESHLARETQSVAPILMRYQRGCQQVLDMMKEVAEDREEEEGDSSDISGYHSDSESAVMTSGNSPFISKEARYSFLSRSVRLGSKHNVRASILASSICLETASSRGGSIKSVPTPSRSRGLQAGPPSLVLHSSSGVSSGSTTSSDDNIDSKQSPNSPTPSCSSAGTVKQRCASGPSSSGPINPVNRSAPRQRLLMKQRQKEVFKISVPVPGSTNCSIQSAPCCPKCDSSESVASTSAGEPVYQGIIERDISVIRKETEIASLNSDLSSVRAELAAARKTIFSLQDHEKRLKERLIAEQHRSATLEKMSKEQHAKQQQQEQQRNKSGYTTGDNRPAALVRKYGELYSQTRLETLDALDKLPQLINSDELKNKLLFSVVVLAFRSVTATIQSKRDQIRRILQLPPPATTNEDKEKTKQEQEQNPAINLDTASREIEEAVTSYLRRATETFDLSKNVEEVCTQIWATLYDYPCLKSTDGIVRYVKECVRVAWGLVNQVPVYTIEYENRHFRSDLHVRFHSSDSENSTIRTYLWPALLEGKDGPCVQKGVVIT